MSDGTLSQDEIDALLQGSDDIFDEGDSSGGGDNLSDSLTNEELSVLKEILKEVNSAQTSTISTLFQADAFIGNPQLEIIDKEQLMDKLDVPFLEISFPFTSGIQGDNMYFLSEDDAITIGAKMLGQKVSELTEMLVSAVAESTSQMVGSSVTTISNKFKTQISTGSPQQIIVKNYNDALFPSDDKFLFISYDMKIDDTELKLLHVMSIQAAKSLVIMDSPTAGPAQAGGGDSPKAEATKSASSGAVKSGDQLQYQQASFSKLNPVFSDEEKKNISLLLDVDMEVTVELGRTRQSVRDILGYSEGSIISLNKIAGEAIDVLVNGKVLARGEVIVIDENFGIRITEIVSKNERLNSLR